jgi:cellular nucleic acid-binding protein
MSKTFDNNPYQGAKEVIPEWTECDVCNRKLKSKDWASHRTSRKHQENVKNASIPGSVTYQTSKANDANQITTPLSPHLDSSDNNRCFNCGQEGHQKADCPNPRDSSNVECRNCNEGESKLTANNCYNFTQQLAPKLVSLRTVFSQYFLTFLSHYL